MLRTRRRQVLATLAALVLLGLGLWGYVASRPARPAAARVVLPIRTDTGWGVIDAATGAVIIPPTESWPVTIHPSTIVGLVGLCAGMSLGAPDHGSRTLTEILAQPEAYTPGFGYESMPPVSVVVAHRSRRKVGLRTSWPFITFYPNSDDRAYTVEGTLIDRGYKVVHTPELMAVWGKSGARMFRIADLQQLDSDPWNAAPGLGLYRGVFGSVGPDWELDRYYGLDGQPCFGPNVTQVWLEVQAEPGRMRMIAGHPSPPPVAEDRLVVADEELAGWRFPPSPLELSETKAFGIKYVFSHAAIQNATVFWETPDRMQPMPGDPFGLMWLNDTGHILARRGSAFYELVRDREPRLIADLATLLAQPDLPDAPDSPWLVEVDPRQNLVRASRIPQEGAPDVRLYWEGTALPPGTASLEQAVAVLEATERQPARLITRAACFVQEADGTLRRVGPIAAADEAYRGCYLAPNRLHLMVDHRRDPDDSSSRDSSRLDSYDLDGTRVASTPISSDVYPLPDTIENSGFFDDADMEIGFLLPFVDDPIRLPVGVAATLSSGNQPARQRLVRSGGDLYVADAAGTRILDLPDDDRSLVHPTAAADLHDFEADLPHLIDFVDMTAQNRVGSISLKRIDDGYQVLDDQQRAFTGRSWPHVVQVNEDILALIAPDELRYIRAADASTIWSWKAVFYVPPGTPPTTTAPPPPPTAPDYDPLQDDFSIDDFD